MELSNIEKLHKISPNKLGAIRQRLGAVNEDDKSFDSQINEMTNSDLVAKYSGWILGDEHWWYSFESFFKNLKEAENQTNG